MAVSGASIQEDADPQTTNTKARRPGTCYRSRRSRSFRLVSLAPRRSGALNRPERHLKSLPNRCSRVFARWRLHFVLFFCEIFMTKLYVGNLPFTATEEAVRNLFAPHGTVEKLSLINDRDTGRPRGFGFVEMSNADASRAMQALNGKDFDGRVLRINEAQDKARSGGGSSRY